MILTTPIILLTISTRWGRGGRNPTPSSKVIAAATEELHKHRGSNRRTAKNKTKTKPNQKKYMNTCMPHENHLLAVRSGRPQACNAHAERHTRALSVLGGDLDSLLPHSKPFPEHFPLHPPDPSHRGVVVMVLTRRLRPFFVRVIGHVMIWKLYG